LYVFFTRVISLTTDKMVFNEINIYFPHNLFQPLNVVSICQWFISYKIILWFLHFSNIHKLWEDILKFVVSSIYIARPGAILSVVREITRMKKIYKRIIYQILNVQTIYCTIQCKWLETCTIIGHRRRHTVSNEQRFGRRCCWWPVANQYLRMLSII
jgi:hypothetical protein